jgi:hypothetical protein
MKVEFDQASGRFVVKAGSSEISVRGRGADLLALLIVTGPGRYLTVDEVHALPGWQSMARESVGKQVARLIDGFVDKGIAAVAYAKKTNGWRLAPEIGEFVDEALSASVKSWLEERSWVQGGRFNNLSAAKLARWALYATRASVAVTAGQADEGLLALKEACNVADHPDLMAIMNLLASRLGQRLSRPHEPVPINRSTASLFELVVEAQRAASYAIRTDSAVWHSQVTELKAMLPRVAAVGNFTTLAYIHNALALLQRRLGDHAAALMHITEAAPLAIFSGDIPLMQSVLFNFGNILSEMPADSHHDVPRDLVRDLIETDISIRQRFSLGKDSAQAELLLASFAIDAGALDTAQSYLDAAQAIIQVSRIPADEALAARITGLLRLKQGDRSGLEFLDFAISLFTATGNQPAAHQVMQERATAAQRLPG